MPGFVNSEYEVDVQILDYNGDPISDIADRTYEMYWYKNGCLIFTLSSGDGISVQDAGTATLRITASADQMKNFGPGSARIVLRDMTAEKWIGEGSEVVEGFGFDA
jgi:hypothetical protein